MNPPGGISLIIHILIVIYGIIRRFVKNILRRVGFTDSRIHLFLRWITNWFRTRLVQQTLAYLIISSIFLAISFSVFIQLSGIIHNKSNFDFIASIIVFYEKKIIK